MLIRSLRFGVPVALAALGACVTLPEAAVRPQWSVAVAAPLERTWESALGQLAAQGLAVRSIEKNAGFIATETVALPMFVTDAAKWADCGTFAGFRYAPSLVDYTLFVGGDSAVSSIKASARYRLIKAAGETPTECVSTGAFEESFSASVKQLAEPAR